MPRRIGVLEVAPDEAFALNADHRLTWDSVPIARLVRGSMALRPRVQVLDSEFLDGAERERIRVRLQAWLDGQIRADLAPLVAAEALARSHPALRGPVHRLTEALGLIPGVDEETLSGDLRSRLRALGVRSGRFALFIPALIKSRPMAMRARLWAMHRGVAMPVLPAAALVSLPVHQPDWPPEFAAIAGWVEAGPILLRLDIAEKVTGELAYRARRGPAVLPSGLASRFGISPDMLPAVLRRLGFRILPAAGLVDDQQGPPAPAMLVPLRRRRAAVTTTPAPPIKVSGGPFAALAALRSGGVR
jgi:ATP-dependent RNA helicase SUPV3L1/SUV3